MATRPATAPEMAPRTLALPPTYHSADDQPSAAAAAAKWVATKALVARVPAARALPALNPNHPTHSKQAPITLSTTLCGASRSVGNPKRLPRYSAHTSAETPDRKSTRLNSSHR